MPRVLITGIGIISAIGFDAENVLKSLKNKQTGVGKLDFIDSVYSSEIPVAEIKATNEELSRLAGINNFSTRTFLLGLIAAKQAIKHAGLENTDLKDTAFISGTTVGGMDKSELFYKKYLNNKNSGKIRFVAGHDCGDSTERIADYLGISGFLSTINTACSSSANAIMMGARLIKHGIVKRALVGGTDSLTKFTINGFNSLMILDRTQCKPFDNNRNGLNLGEGSGFLMLESEDILKSSGKEILAEVKGHGNACDAFHQTASSPEGNGAYFAMQKAIETAQVLPSEISYINTHGTGTRNNDLSEGIAIQRIFGSNIPPNSSTKSYTGHTLGASGAIEAVISILAMKNNCIFPNLNYSDQMQELSFAPEKDLKNDVDIYNIMSNSFGFGGNNSSLIFSKY